VDVSAFRERFGFLLVPTVRLRARRDLAALGVVMVVHVEVPRRATRFELRDKGGLAAVLFQLLRRRLLTLRERVAMHAIAFFRVDLCVPWVRIDLVYRTASRHAVDRPARTAADRATAPMVVPADCPRRVFEP
jgi:hypothetical protein